MQMLIFLFFSYLTAVSPVNKWRPDLTPFSKVGEDFWLVALVQPWWVILLGSTLLCLGLLLDSFLFGDQQGLSERTGEIGTCSAPL